MAVMEMIAVSVTTIWYVVSMGLCGMWSWSDGGAIQPRAMTSASTPYAASDDTAVHIVALPPRASADVSVLSPKNVLSGELAPPVA